MVECVAMAKETMKPPIVKPWNPIRQKKRPFDGGRGGGRGRGRGRGGGGRGRGGGSRGRGGGDHGGKRGRFER